MRAASLRFSCKCCAQGRANGCPVGVLGVALVYIDTSLGARQEGTKPPYT